jgi:sulfate adenylyltransferase subunit 1
MPPILLPALDQGLLRFVTCGSVDDGKSTLIGRLLYDCKAILADALDNLRRASTRRGASGLDLSLITDGLQAEREQGITIDVAYRYFATATRKYILGDAPGHEQYTRNMVTAASTADLAIILVDASKGVLPQTRRHAALAHLLGVRRLVVAVNKMDLAGWSRERFQAIRADCLALAGGLGAEPPECLPISALAGDGVVDRGGHMPWYQGPTLLETLEAAPSGVDRLDLPLRMPVQWVCRPRQGGEFRAYAGRLASGEIQAGAEVLVLPAGARTRVQGIWQGEEELAAARMGQSVLLALADQLDVGRGDLLAGTERPPTVTRRLEADLCWFAETPATPGDRLLLRAGTREVRARLEAIRSRLDIASLAPAPARELAMNDIGRVSLALQAPIAAEPFQRNPATGAFILVDGRDNGTVAGGMVRGT